MLIVLFIVFLLIMCSGIWLSMQSSRKFRSDAIDFCRIGFICIGIVADIILIILIISCCFYVSKAKVIDEKIIMYQEENQLIERQVSEIVSDYKNYEEQTIDNVGKIATILIRFPELKSNKLVSKQIDVYVKNNDKIKKLKEEKIDYQVLKWWLYFGGNKK